MDFGRLDNSKKLKAGVAVVIVLAVVSGAYLVFSTPTEISNAEELQQIRENPSGDYVLVDDIDLSHIENFEPIENFTGTFDGNGHTISNLTIDRPETNSAGLFSTVGEDTRFFGLVEDEGIVRNVRLRDVNVTGNETVGGLVGVNLGTITGSYVRGDVTAKSRIGVAVGLNGGDVSRTHTGGKVVGNESIGGLAGYSNSKGKIIRSHSEVSVFSEKTAGGTDGEAGGLVGVNWGKIRNSDATGDVLVGGGGLIGINRGVVRGSYATGYVKEGGGLVGWNIGTVRSSYATGNVSGGGLVGGNNGKVETSYAVGNLTGEMSGGLIVGSNGGDVTNSYWDINTTGQDDSAGGKPLTTSEMTGSAARENMEGFDFNETWQTVTNPDDYPRLAWQDIEDYSSSYDEPPEDTSTNQTQMQSEDSTSTDLVSFSGLIFKNRTVRSLQWFYLENRTDNTNQDGDDFTMQGIDADGNVVSSQSFDAPFRAYVSPSEKSPIDTNVTTFVLKEEYPYDLAKFRLVENETTVAEFNPNVGLLRTAVESIPRTGFKQQEVAERRRKTLLNEIDALENTIEDGNTQDAVRKMENDIKPSLDRLLEDGYETKSALQLTKDEVLTTAEAVTERLRAQRERRSRR